MADYKPMTEVYKTFRIKWYRCPVKPEKLKELTSRSDFKGLMQSIGHIGLAVCTGVLTYYLFNQKMWVLFALALFVHGTVYSFLGQAGHELSHGTVFKTKWLNWFFLRLYSIFKWYNFHHYKMSHMYHHLYTLHPQGDREVVLPQDASLKFLKLLQLFTFNVSRFVSFCIATTRQIFLGGFDAEWSKAIYANQEAELRKSINWVRILVAFNLAVIVVSIVFKRWLLPVLIVFAPFIGNWWRHFVGLPMHAGLRDNVDDFRKCVRSIKLDPISRFLYWHMNFHLEHHMYAAVPFYNLKKLQKEIAKDMPEPKSLVGAWREMRETWKRQQVYPSYQYDTPVPTPADSDPIVSHPLESSIGEIEPKHFAGD